MSIFSYASYRYDCSVPLCYISFINLSLSVASISLPEFDIVKASSRICDTEFRDLLSQIFAGVTVIISLTTILGTLYDCRKAILFLFAWDCYRFLFVIWALTGAQGVHEFVFYPFLVGWLVLCFLTEMSHLSQPEVRQTIPPSTISALLEECGIYNSQRRLNIDRPPSYHDVVSSPYSPKQSPARSSTVTTITEGFLAAGVSASEIPPPAYESLGFDKNPRF